MSASIREDFYRGKRTSVTFQAVADKFVTTDKSVASACSGPSRNSGRKMPLKGSNLSTELDGGAAELRRRQYQKRAEEAAKAMTEIKKKFPKTQLIKHEASKMFSHSVQELTVVKEGKTVQILKGFDLDIILKAMATMSIFLSQERFAMTEDFMMAS